MVNILGVIVYNSKHPNLFSCSLVYNLSVTHSDSVCSSAAAPSLTSNTCRNICAHTENSVFFLPWPVLAEGLPRTHLPLLSYLTGVFDAMRVAWERDWAAVSSATPCGVPSTTAIAGLHSNPSSPCLISRRAVLWAQPCPLKSLCWSSSRRWLW